MVPFLHWAVMSKLYYGYPCLSEIHYAEIKKEYMDRVLSFCKVEAMQLLNNLSRCFLDLSFTKERISWGNK